MDKIKVRIIFLCAACQRKEFPAQIGECACKREVVRDGHTVIEKCPRTVYYAGIKRCGMCAVRTGQCKACDNPVAPPQPKRGKKGKGHQSEPPEADEEGRDDEHQDDRGRDSRKAQKGRKGKSPDRDHEYFKALKRQRLEKEREAKKAGETSFRPEKD